MNREQLKAAEQAALDEIEAIKANIKKYRASMDFLDRRDVRKVMVAGAAVVIALIGLAYKYL